MEKDKDREKEKLLQEYKARDKTLTNESEAEQLRLKSELKGYKSECKISNEDKDRMLKDICMFEEKLKKEMLYSSELEKELIKRDRDLEREADEHRRSWRDKAHHDDILTNMQEELSNLLDGKEKNEIKYIGVLRMLEASNKDIEYLKEEIKNMEVKYTNECKLHQECSLRIKQSESESKLKEEQISACKSDIENCKREHDKLEKDLDLLKNVIKEKDEELIGLRGAGNRAEILIDRVSVLERDRELNIEELERLKRYGDNWIADEKMYKDDQDKLKRCLLKSEDELNRCEKDVERLKKFEYESGKLGKNVKDQLKEESLLKNQLANCNETIEKLEKNIDDVEVKCKGLEARIVEKEHVINDNHKMIQDMDQLVKEMEEELGHSRIEITDLRKKIKDKHTTYISICDKLHNSELKIEELKDLYTHEEYSKKCQFEEFAEHKDASQKYKTEKNQTIERQTKSNQNLEKKKEELLLRLEADAKSYEKLTEEKKRAMEDINQLKEKFVKNEQDFLETKNVIKLASSEKESLLSTIYNREDELDSMRDRYEELYQIYSGVKLNFTQTMNQSQQVLYKIEELDYQLSNQKARNAELIENIEELKTKVRSKEAEIDTQGKNINVVTGQNRELAKEIERKNDQIEEMRNRVVELETREKNQRQQAILIDREKNEAIEHCRYIEEEKEMMGRKIEGYEETQLSNKNSQQEMNQQQRELHKYHENIKNLELELGVVKLERDQYSKHEMGLQSKIEMLEQKQNHSSSNPSEAKSRRINQRSSEREKLAPSTATSGLSHDNGIEDRQQKREKAVREEMQRQVNLQNNYLTEDIKQIRGHNDVLQVELEKARVVVQKYEGVLLTERKAQQEMFQYTKQLEKAHQDLATKSRKVFFFCDKKIEGY